MFPINLITYDLPFWNYVHQSTTTVHKDISIYQRRRASMRHSKAELSLIDWLTDSR